MRASRFYKLNVVFRPKAEEPFADGESEKLIQVFCDWCKYYFPSLQAVFYITHYDEGCKHVHFCVFSSSSDRHTLKTYLKDIYSYMSPKLPKRDFRSAFLQLEELYNDNGSIRYLAHLDDEDKELYPVGDIEYFGYMAKDMLFSALNNVQEMTFSSLMEVVRKCHFDLVSIINVLGIKTYNRHRNVIKDIIHDYYKHISRMG